MYTRSDNFPDFDFVKNGRNDFIAKHYVTKKINNKGEKTPEEEKMLRWANDLETYGFSYRRPEEIDIEIANSVERGYFIEQNIIKEIKKYNDNIIINKQDKSLTDAWNLYHDSFDDNHEEVVEKMYKAVKNHAKHISQSDLSASLKLLRDLGSDKKADELLEMVISSRTDNDYFDINSYAFYSVTDQKMRDRFEQEYNKRNPPKTPKEVLNHLISNNGWSNKDVEILSALSEEGYYNLFKNEKSIDCHYWIKVCLKFAGNTEKEKLIVTKAVAALKKIGSESKLNKIRVEQYGIKINDIVEVEAVDLKP